MSDYNLGTAKGVIEIGYKGDGAKQARRDIEATSRGSRGASVEIDKIGRRAGIAGALIAGGFAVAAKTAADFEQNMSKVEAVAGASADEMDSLRDKAIQLGKDTAFSAGESAQAMEELAKAGISVQDILTGAADATVALAAAGSIDMPTAAGIASAAMNSFGIAGKDAAHVADLMSGAANKSATDVVGVGEAFKYVAPLAASTGVSIEDTTTAIAALAKQGITGSMAGTTLRGMLQNLNPASKAAAAAMKELGIITKDGSNQFFDAEGNTKSMADISGILAKSLNGLSDQQKSQALSTIFGARAMTGALALAKQGKKGFTELGTAIGKVSAEDVAATKMDNLKGSLEQLSGTLETIGITVGSFLLPALKSLADGTLSLLNKFLDLDSGTQKMIATVIGIVGASLLALAAFIKIVRMLQAVKAAFVAVRAIAVPAWLAALGPAALVVLAIAAVVAILVILYKKSETFRNIVNAVWGSVQAAAGALASWFTGTFLPAIVGVWTSIQNAASTVWNAIVMVIQTVIGVISSVITTGLNAIKAIWNAVWGTFGPLVMAYFGLVIAIVRLVWVIVKGVFILYIRLLKSIVMGGFNAIKAVVSAVMNAVASVIRAVWGAIGPYVMGVVNRIRSGIATAWNAVKNVTSTVWNAIKGVITKAIDAAVKVVTGIKSRIMGPLASAGTWLYDKGKEIIQGLINGITAMIGKVTDAIKGVTDKIAGFLPGSPVREGPLKVLNNGYAGKKIVEMVSDGIGGGIDPLQYALQSMLKVDMGGSGLGAAVAPSAPGPRSPAMAGGGGSSPSRLVQGTLSLDASGRAFITGIAEDVYGGFAGDDGRRGDMSW